MDIAPNMAVLGFKMYRATTPIRVMDMAIIKAVRTDMRPEGKGRFLVRFIIASKSFSIIWLYALEAPTMQYPPNASSPMDTTSNFAAPKKYPAMEENTTLTANLALVISLNSERTKERELLFTEPTADFIHELNWLAKIGSMLFFSNPLTVFVFFLN